MSENLGVICNAHVVHADLSDEGALDEKCIKLAELAALAVDFPKTGKVVSMPHYLKAKAYPDFMGKAEFMSYKSTKILGRLYHKARDSFLDTNVSEEAPVAPEDIHYDLYLEVPGAVNFITDAWTKKCSYDGAINALLEQYKVRTEEEVVTGNFWSMPKYNSRKQGDLKERLKNAYRFLKREFRELFEALEAFDEELGQDEKNAIYEQKASAWYQVTYHPKWLKKSLELRETGKEHYVPVRLSFAWIADDYLVRIKVRSRGQDRNDSSKPINFLAKYLADEI